MNKQQNSLKSKTLQAEACKDCRAGHCCGSCWCCFDKDDIVSQLRLAIRLRDACNGTPPYFLPNYVIPREAFGLSNPPTCELCRVNPADILEDGVNYCPGCFAAYGKPWPGEIEEAA